MNIPQRSTLKKIRRLILLGTIIVDVMYFTLVASGYYTDDED